VIEPVSDAELETDEVTVDVKVTLAPTVCGLALEVMAVVVVTGVGRTIDSVRTAEVLAEWFVSPL
jgi:hypothetical protein